MTPRSPLFLRCILAIDFFMIALLVVNVILLLFDTAFRGSVLIQRLLEQHLSSFHRFYKSNVHDNFALIDSAFVALFIVELLVRWAVAAKRRTYHRWFFYPLIHWYDVLGCIPVGSMRMLRLFRLVAIGWRLHRLGVIDVEKFYLYRVFVKYKEIVVEEVSDRVVVHVLGGVQEEVTRGSPMIARIWQEVVEPHKDEIAERIMIRAQAVMKENAERHRPLIKAYVDRVLSEALRRSRHVFVAFEAIPMVGRTIVQQIETAVKVIVDNVFSELLDDVDHLEVRAIAGEIERVLATALSERDARIEDIVRHAVHQSLEIVKEQVQVQQWKLRELEEQAAT